MQFRLIENRVVIVPNLSLLVEPPQFVIMTSLFRVYDVLHITLVGVSNLVG